MSAAMVADFAWYGTSVAAFVATTLWAASAFTEWRSFTGKAQAISVILGILLAVLCYGTIEAARLDSPLGLRVVLLAACLIALSAALLWPPSRLVRRHR